MIDRVSLIIIFRDCYREWVYPEYLEMYFIELVSELGSSK
jgi:hypothetical protein